VTDQLKPTSEQETDLCFFSPKFDVLQPLISNSKPTGALALSPFGDSINRGRVDAGCTETFQKPKEKQTIFMERL